MSALDPENLSRTTLLLMRRAGDVDAGAERHKLFALRLIASASTCSSRAGQAALLTTVKTAVRALSYDQGECPSRVTVVLADPGHPVLGGPGAGATLGDLVEQEGARLATGSDQEPATPTVILGQPPAEMDVRDGDFIATWTGWAADVAPYGRKHSGGQRCDGNVLAAIAAGALAVAAVFFQFARPADSGTSSSALHVDLWSPDEAADRTPPDLCHAPAQWWLLGLGHLGQGYAHAISWLDYTTPAEVSIVVQDTQRTVPANHSTGLFTPRGSDGHHKTRLVADALERCGLTTTIIERLMDEPTAVRASDMHVGLVGVDNLPTRRSIDAFGWHTTIDVGLGPDADDFDGITLVRFPGRPSVTIPAWQEPARQKKDPAGDMWGAPEQDVCGVARLNDVAVGASFVGAFAGVLAVVEALRPLHGGAARSVLCLSLHDGEIEGARSERPGELPIASDLRH